MEIIKGSDEYIIYIERNIFPDVTVENYIGTIDHRTQTDMLDTDELITYSDQIVKEHMEENGYTLITSEEKSI